MFLVLFMFKVQQEKQRAVDFEKSISSDGLVITKLNEYLLYTNQLESRGDN